MWTLTCIPVNVYNVLYKFKPVFRCALAPHFWVFCWLLIALILDNGKEIFIGTVLARIIHEFARNLDYSQ